MATSKLQPALPVLPNGEAATAACWSCGDMRAAQFCCSCGKVQPPAPTDFFSFFGLPRKLELDPAALEAEMLALSRRLHPDLYARATRLEQDWSLEQTSKLNNAYRTLRDPVRRTEYLLRLEGIRSSERSKQATEEARTTGEKKQAVPPELLEEVFELNLQMEGYRATRKAGGDDPDLRRELEAAEKTFEHKLEEVDGELRACWSRWDALIGREGRGETVTPVERHEVLASILGVINRRRYVDHLIEEIGTALE